MEIIGHRGVIHEELENSFSSFQKAIDIGCQRIEFDTQLCADGEIIIMHDTNLRRTTGVNLRVTEINRDQAKSIALNNGESIPFFDELCEKFVTQIEFNVELKANSIALARTVVDTLKRFPNRKRCIISSFHLEPLVYLKEKHPEFERACLIEGHFHWPQLSLSSPVVMAQETATKIIHPWSQLVDANFMDQAKARNWTVYPYCALNREEEENREGVWTRMKTLGVDGLCTNFPRELKQWLEEIRVYE